MKTSEEYHPRRSVSAATRYLEFFRNNYVLRLDVVGLTSNCITFKRCLLVGSVYCRIYLRVKGSINYGMIKVLRCLGKRFLLIFFVDQNTSGCILSNTFGSSWESFESNFAGTSTNFIENGNNGLTFRENASVFRFPCLLVGIFWILQTHRPPITSDRLR